nr:immunoglobulin light chain junction region [Macaca mulatta]MOW12849.1 immunoglobulin light chain junction region [Macaca mulatta]MOW12873.1 immunoglobulin light chain junction region [Macaca mulatta]MOW14303.1 immunoglobulin light chain junction region [Macaca mulatta]
CMQYTHIPPLTF